MHGLTSPADARPDETALDPPRPAEAIDIRLPLPEPIAPLVTADPNEVLAFGAMKVKRFIVEAVLKAAEETGADPVYMMALADKESSLSPESAARTSSAEGLFQFIEQTWLECIGTFGPAYGLASEADAIEVDPTTGQRSVADPETRERILSLRRNPYLSAVMAAEMLERDRDRIEEAVGRELTYHEFYLAHFLGPMSAARFLKLMDEKPKQAASKEFPAAARANRTIFYARKGKKSQALTVTEVHERIAEMIAHRLNRYTAVSALSFADEHEAARF